MITVFYRHSTVTNTIVIVSNEVNMQFLDEASMKRSFKPGTNFHDVTGMPQAMVDTLTK